MRKLIALLKVGVPIGIGIYLVWYFISGLTPLEISQVKASFVEADYFWVILGLLVSFLSHLSRAKRWLLLVYPMGYFPSIASAFHGVMAGYIINYTIPRSGEFARAGLMAKYEGVPFEKGFGTIVVERIFDLLMLGLVFLITGYMQIDAKGFSAIAQSNETDQNQSLPIIVLIGMVLVVSAIIAYFFSPRIQDFIREKLRGIWEGLTSFWKMQEKWNFLGHTFFIWVCYVGGIWIFAQAFPETADMPIGCVFGAFVVGATAIALLPGGLGAYPLWVSAVLNLYGIDFPGYGVFMWVAITILMIVFGLLALFLIQRKKEVDTKR
ncbi:MAG: flippase-like domain-containing protein [Saprospiraceae bacterium]|nr:flippase-like domain-containing protein [Saprospiraceae bacterium]